jgi:hypothetical protein
LAPGRRTIFVIIRPQAGDKKGVTILKPKTLRLVLVLLMGAISVGTAACGNADGTNGAKPLAVVDGSVMTVSDWKQAVAATDLVQGVHLSTTPAAERREVKELASEWAVEAYALRHHWITASRARREANLFINENLIVGYGGKNKADEALARSHLTWADVREFMTRQMELDAAFARIAQKVRPVSSETVFAYYQKHVALFRTPAQDQVRTMVVPSRTLAQDVVSQLQHGASWTALARHDARGSLTDDGYHWVYTGPASGLLPHVYQVMDRLKPGHEAFVHTGQGWEILEVSAQRPPTIEPYGAVKAQLQAALMQQREDLQFQAFSKTIADQSVHLYR